MNGLRLKNDALYGTARLPFRVGAVVVTIVYGEVLVSSWEILGKGFLLTTWWILASAAMLTIAVKGRLPVDIGTRVGRLQLVIFILIVLMIHDLIRGDVDSFLNLAALASGLGYLLVSERRKESQESLLERVEMNR